MGLRIKASTKARHGRDGDHQAQRVVRVAHFNAESGLHAEHGAQIDVSHRGGVLGRAVQHSNEVARRAYSSDAANYPTSGTKPIRYDSWFDIVHKDKRYFVANSIADIATFPWIRNLIGFYESGDLVGIADFPNVLRALDGFVARPAVIRGLNIPS